jgi:hypothetical protein
MLELFNLLKTKLLNDRGQIHLSRFTVLPLNIPLTPKFPRQHKNASPSLCRLEMMVDDDDGDEVNWSMEHESRPI